MKMTIYKYLIPTSPNGINNYFYSSTQADRKLAYYDKFESSRQLLNSFPIFREEWTKEENIDLLKTGYFDMKLAISMSERSYTLGHSVTDFFEDIESGIGKFKYVIVCETGTPERTYSGVIDTNTVEADLSVNDNQYYVTFSVTGIEKEAIQLMKLFPITRIQHDMSFEGEYLSNLFYNILSDKLILESTLDIQSKINQDIIIDRTIQNNVFNANFDIDLQTNNIKVWNAFRSFLVGYGFRFKILYEGNNGEFPLFKMNLFFRTDGLNNVTINKFLKHKKAYITSGAEYIAIFYSFYTDTVNPDIDHYQGVIFNINEVYVTGQSAYIDHYKNSNYYRLPNFKTIPAEVVFKLDLQIYPSGGASFNIAYCRCVAGQSLNPLITWIANTQLGFLLRGFRSKQLLTIKVPDDSNIILGTKAEIDNKSYTLERITSFDNFNNKMETEWIEE